LCVYATFSFTIHQAFYSAPLTFVSVFVSVPWSGVGVVCLFLCFLLCLKSSIVIPPIWLFC
jgi:hypothetical protein